MKRRDLSGEERELWALVTRDVKPARKRVRRPTPRDAGSQTALQVEERGKSQKGPFILKRAPTARVLKDRAPSPPAGGAKTKPPPALGGGDPNVDRRAAKGLIPIEARLDLHGMTEPVAQARVTRFILAAREDGLRLVLVITGKGSRGAAGTAREGRGVIRARFLDWIETEPLRTAIARAAPAKPKDGGAGAFYVFLKRKTRG